MESKSDGLARGKRIADSIRKLLLNCDLRLVYADGEQKIAQEDFKLYSKLSGNTNRRKALYAKARVETYKVFIKKITEIKGDITLNLDAVLSRYTPKYKKIWVMYFIEQASIDEICNAVAYSRGNVNVIIKKLKQDLNHYYGGKENDKRRWIIGN